MTTDLAAIDNDNFDISDVRARVLAAMAQLDSTFIQRRDAIRCIALAELSRANYMLLGDPGTAKTALARRWLAHVSDASTFVVLCGSFATEDKVFGPVDIDGFKQGKWGRVLDGRLAAVTHAFLDEMMKSNDGTLNGMLTALNEREYEGRAIPLRVCGAASNWPEIRSRSDNVAALWDRVLLRCEVKEVEGEDAEADLLEAAERVEAYDPVETFTVEEIDRAHEWIVANVSVSCAARKTLAKVRARLAKEGVTNSGRRLAQLQNVLRANAWLDGREEVSLEDFAALRFGLWHDKEQIGVVQTTLDAVDHETVQRCTGLVDKALAQHSRLRSLSPQRRLEESPAVIAAMTEAAKEVKATLREYGVTAKGRERVAKQMATLKARFDELSAEVNKHLNK